MQMDIHSASHSLFIQFHNVTCVLTKPKIILLCVDMIKEETANEVSL